MRFQKGDIVVHTGECDDVMIVFADPAPYDPDGVLLSAWREEEGDWGSDDDYQGVVDRKTLALHPDPDPIWADYCAWKLTLPSA